MKIAISLLVLLSLAGCSKSEHRMSFVEADAIFNARVQELIDLENEIDDSPAGRLASRRVFDELGADEHNRLAHHPDEFRAAELKVDPAFKAYYDSRRAELDELRSAVERAREAREAALQ